MGYAIGPHRMNSSFIAPGKIHHVADAKGRLAAMRSRRVRRGIRAPIAQPLQAAPDTREPPRPDLSICAVASCDRAEFAEKVLHLLNQLRTRGRQR